MSTRRCSPPRSRAAAPDRRAQLSPGAPCDKNSAAVRAARTQVQREAFRRRPCPTPRSFPCRRRSRKASHCDNAKYQAMYRRSIDDPDGFWREQAERLDWIKFPTRIKDVDFKDDARIRWFEDGVLNVSVNCIDRHLQSARRSDRDPVGRRRARASRQEDQLSRAAPAGVQARQRAEGSRGQEGRPGHDLHADDPRDRLRHARVRADRRDPFGGVRRLLARQLGEPDQRLRQQARDHDRRRQARRAQRPAQAATPTRR